MPYPRTYFNFLIPPGFHLVTRLMDWSRNFSRVLLLNSNRFSDPYSRFELLAAFGVRREFSCDGPQPWSPLAAFFQEDPDWIFGHFSFETGLPDPPFLPVRSPYISFGVCSFFQPEILLKIQSGSLQVGIHGDRNEAEAIVKELFSSPGSSAGLKVGIKRPPYLKPVHTDAEYLDRVNYLISQMMRGNIYEINYCREFQARDVQLDPSALYLKLNAMSAAPFSAYYRQKERFLVCSSPERFVSKTGMQLIAQPIKGTIRRGTSAEEEKSVVLQLQSSSKERAENTMIVDLLRNDLARTARCGSVEVLEWAVPYPFSHVHHLISTVTAQLDPSKHPLDVIRYCFPMGSMTGAPKKKVCELIHEVEDYGRGLFSGSVGYISPEWDYDFNVVIRSLIYDAAAKLMNYHVGSGLTVYSQPLNELDELNLKAKALRACLGLEG